MCVDVFATLQGGPGAASIGQGGMHAAGSNGDKAMQHVCNALCCSIVSCVAVTHHAGLLISDQ